MVLVITGVNIILIPIGKDGYFPQCTKKKFLRANLTGRPIIYIGKKRPALNRFK